MDGWAWVSKKFASGIKNLQPIVLNVITCVKIGGSLWMFFAFWFLKYPEMLSTVFKRKRTIESCAKNGYHGSWLKTTNVSKVIFLANFSPAVQAKLTTFRLSQVRKPGRSSSHLRPNNNHESVCISFRPNLENWNKHSMLVKSWQLCFGFDRGYCWSS